MYKEIINTNNAPAPIGPYSQAVCANGFMFISGQVAIIPETSQIVSGSIKDETTQVMKNIGAILATKNIDFSAIIKTSIFLSDMSLFAEVNEVYATYFSHSFPARETVAVKGLPKGVNVEISVTVLL